MKTLDTSGSFLNGHCHTIHALNALEIIWDVFSEVRVPIWKDCRESACDYLGCPRGYGEPALLQCSLITLAS